MKAVVQEHCRVVSMLKKVSGCEMRTVSTHDNIGDCLCTIGQHDDALEDFRNAI